MEPLAASPLGQRLANAVVAYAMYLRDALWPAGLAVFYPRAQWPGSWVAASLAVLLAITAAALSRVERAPYWIVGWAWYLLGILPVSGIVQVGDQARADRFTYLPLAGLFLAAAVSAEHWAQQVAVRRGAVALAGGGILLAWAGATSEQVRVWRNTETLFRHALQVTRDNHVAHANLGAYLVERGRGAEARPHLEEALQLRPLSPLAHISLGVLEMQEGNLAAAEQHFHDVLAALPEHGAAHFNLALVLRARGDRSGAIEHVQRALARQPDHAKGLVLLGDLLAEGGQVAAAEEAYRKALRAKPDLAAAHNQLALLLEARGRSEEALAHYRELVRLAPDDARAHFNLAAALRDHGQQQEARTHFRRALEIAERQGDPHLAANARAALETPE
jgi:tetratricopeptide (TPR) repeat protein